MDKRNLAKEVDRIAADANLAEIERLAAAFGYVTRSFIEQSERDLELARAMQDEESAVKEQIKAGVMNTAREMFEYCYLTTTGSRRSIWHEQDES